MLHVMSIHAYIHTCVDTRMFACVGACMRVCMCKCVHVYTHACMYTVYKWLYIRAEIIHNFLLDPNQSDFFSQSPIFFDPINSILIVLKNRVYQNLGG